MYKSVTKNLNALSESEKLIGSKRQLQYVLRNTAWKVSKCAVFSGLYFPVVGLNKEIYSIFNPNKGKWGPEKTPYLDTFHLVKVSVITLFSMSNIIWYFNTSLPGTRRFCQKIVWSALGKELYRTLIFSFHFIFINITIESNSQQGNNVNTLKK